MLLVRVLLIKTMKLVIVIIVLIVLQVLLLPIDITIILKYQVIFLAILLIELLLLFSCELLPQMMSSCLGKRNNPCLFLCTFTQSHTTISRPVDYLPPAAVSV